MLTTRLELAEEKCGAGVVVGAINGRLWAVMYVVSG